MNARENYSILHGEASFSGTLCAPCFCITGQSTAMSAPPKMAKPALIHRLPILFMK